MIKKILTYFIFPVAIIALLYLVVDSIMQPVLFQKELKNREKVAIERLKDIRTLQVAYKTQFGKFTASADTLTDFYNNGQVTVVRQIGSFDDSLAVAQKRVRRDSIKINAKDTIFTDKANFNIDSIFYIPFSGGQKIEVLALIKEVSGVNVPLFEANIPYDILLKGLDQQLIINLKAEKEDLGRYTGLKVGSISSPNNNAGNWE